MKHRTHRLRRVAAAIALGVGGLGSVIGLAAGTAGAATPHITIKATSAPNVGSTGTGLGAGSLTLTIPATATTVTEEFDFYVTTALGHGDVTWTTASVSHSSGSIGPLHLTGTDLYFTVFKAAGTTDTIHITDVTIDTTTAHGTISVHPAATGFKFSPTSVVNAKAPGAPTTFFTDHSLTATTDLPLAPTGTGQAAATWTIHLKGAETHGWAATETVDITVTVPTFATDNCTLATHGFVVFTGTPTVTVASSTKTSTTPTVSDSTSAGGFGCTGANHNRLSVKFTNSGTLTGTTGAVTIAISGVKYDVGGTVDYTTINVRVSDVFIQPTTDSTGVNGYVTTAYLLGNTPPKTVTPKAFDAAISPVELIENVPDTVDAGWVCLWSDDFSFNPLSTATAKVANSGDAVITPKVTYETGTTAATTATSAEYARFEVKTSSTTKASTFEVSGLAVNAPTAADTYDVEVYTELPGNTCNHSLNQAFGFTGAFSVGQTSTQIYGQTADATAAAELSTVYSHTGTPATCPHTRVVVLATDEHFQDALSSAYLASSLTTGTLLTPTSSLSSATLTELRVEGIRQVDIVGGSFAVSTTVVNELETTPAYACGGKTLTATGGKQNYISVNRIAGPTQYGTAAAVAKYVGTTTKMSIASAYLGVNATKGTGAFNDTAGTGSAVPALSGTLKTVIVASGQEFQDAEAASVLSYGDGIPILLTPATSLSTTAVTAIHYLGAQQVILLGGPLAVTNTVANKMETTLGLSVVRVAGKDATDTATKLADFIAAPEGTGAGWTTITTVMVARGNGYTDGLAGAIIGGHYGEPLLLTESPTTVGTYLTTFLKEAGHTGIDAETTNVVTTLTILGGPAAITPATIAQMQADL